MRQLNLSLNCNSYGMWEARQFVPMLVKTVRGLCNDLAAAVIQDPHKSECIQGREMQKKKKKDIFTCKMESCTPTHTPTYYFAGSPIKEDIRPMQRRETSSQRVLVNIHKRSKGAAVKQHVLVQSTRFAGWLPAWQRSSSPGWQLLARI